MFKSNIYDGVKSYIIVLIPISLSSNEFCVADMIYLLCNIFCIYQAHYIFQRTIKNVFTNLGWKIVSRQLITYRNIIINHIYIYVIKIVLSRKYLE